MMRIASSLSSELHPRELGELELRCKSPACRALLPGKKYAYCLTCRRARSVDEAARIAARKAKRTRPVITADAPGLGVEPDAVVAANLGVRENSVCMARKRYGIAAPREASGAYVRKGKSDA